MKTNPVSVRLLMQCIVVLSFLCTIEGAVFAETPFPVTPKTHNGKKWRIGYIEGGSYQDYQDVLKALIEGLADLGWLEKKPFPKPTDEKETRTIWNWLANDVRSDYLEFVENAYWSAGWNKNLRKENTETLNTRINTKKDMDLILAFGTWAGQDLANNHHSVPTIILSVSDPLQSGIIRSNEDSGYDHIHTRVDPSRYKRQLRLFHEIVRFTKIGIAYEDTPSGKTYAALEDIRTVAKERGFEVLECAIPENTEEFLLKCHQSLAPRVDSFYLTNSKAVNAQSLPMLLEPFFKYKVPTFSQGRIGEVRQGVLMSLAHQDLTSLGKFFAESFSRILNGAKPRSLPMLFESSQEITINLETARRIGFRFPIEILAGAKETYNRIEDK